VKPTIVKCPACGRRQRRSTEANRRYWALLHEISEQIKPDGKQFGSDYQPAERWTEKRATELGIELIEWLNKKDEQGDDEGNIFFEEFLVIEKDLYPQLIDYLSDKFSSFSKLIEKAKKIQEIKLVKYGCFDKLNATMTKFTLQNNHGWKYKSEHDHMSKGEKIQSLPPLTAGQVKEISNNLEDEY